MLFAILRLFLKLMGESGKWTPNCYVIKRLEVIGVVLLKLQAIWYVTPCLSGHSRRFRVPLNVHQHLCDKLKSPMTVHNNILKKCLSSSANWQFIAVCTKADRWTLFSARLNTYRPVSMSSVSMSPNQYFSLSLSLSNDISSGLRSTILYALLLSAIYSVSPVHFFNILSDSVY